MDLKQKEIVLLPYPFSDQGGSKVRPAIVVSNNFFNKSTRDCVMVPLTTVIKDVPYSILIDQKDLNSGNLLKPSRIRIDKIFTIHENLVMMKIGIINDETFEKIRGEIRKVF